ncbi:hypothetical protein CA85_00880 [Allorhodopirellula solitaria]|uniref:Uncharacterized protein n=1 Tax=Allorhodopirellula solitaria TaxID=2527987 RepID=A0A5C5YIV2_9BACT|nr:hypothetical protein CA85_00880 [Allorhodopirellula solitaria]
MVGRSGSFFANEVPAISLNLSQSSATPADIRLRSVAAILAVGIRRLHLAAVESDDRDATSEPVSGNLADSLPERLDDVGPGGLSVTDVSETTGFETDRESPEMEMKHAR